MKILLIRSLNPYFEIGASASRFEGIINGLLKQGIKITLLVTGGYNTIAEYKAKGRQPQMSRNLSVHYTVFILNNNIWLRRIYSYLLNDYFLFLNKLKTKKYFVSKNYDLIWLNINADILEMFAKHRKLVSAKTLIELNEFIDIYKEVGHLGNRFQLKKAKISEEIFFKTIGQIDLFAVMTRTLITHYRKMVKPDAVFLHLPMTVDLSRFETRSIINDYSKPYIAYTGTFCNSKDGTNILIDAFAKIAQIYPDLHLYLAGFYHYDVALQKEQITRHNLKQRITYLGILRKDQVPAFLQNSALLVLPRPESHQANGGFPTKLGEYLATGNPVCVTKVGEIPDYLEDNVSAFLAEPGNVDSFADTMYNALSDKTNAKRVGANGKKVAETHFDIDIQTRRLVTFLEENINKHTSPVKKQ